MKLLFIHQNFPGQYRHLATRFAAEAGNRVFGLGDRGNLAGRPRLPGVEMLAYPAQPGASAGTHAYVRSHESAVRRGQAVARALLELRRRGVVPDVICAHPGWGEALFVKDVMPESRLLGYFEFYYRGAGSDVGFDPEFPASLDERCRVRVKNSTMLVSLDAADAGIAPTRWQEAQFPAAWQAKIAVIHDGIDTDGIRPDPDDRLTLPDGEILTTADEVVTFVARNLEPYRGFHVFMRALPRILERRPQARVVIVGGDEVSYGRPPDSGGTYREQLLAECGDAIDPGRVHFLGRVPYPRYLSVLHVSSVHVYLTYPFVLSWSLLEAMAAGCLVVASRTPPVTEVVEDGVNGWLTDFFAVEALAERVCEALASRRSLASLAAAARQTIVEGYDLQRLCLPRQTELVRGLAGGKIGGS